MSTVFAKTTTTTKTVVDKLRALNIDEYEYAFEAHFDETEVMDRYNKEKQKHPDALVVIEDLPCGHFEINLYKTEKDKQAFYRRRWVSVFAEFWKTLST